MLFSILLACSGAPEAPDVPPAPPTDPVGDIVADRAKSPRGKGTKSPAPPADDPAPSEPFVIAPAQGGMSVNDHFTFWGWSADGARYAYETWYPGAGGADCEGEVEIIVVDAAKDAYVRGADHSFTHDSPEGGPDGCSSPAPKDAADAARDGILAEHGIVVGAVGERATFSGAGSSMTLALPGGGSAGVSFEITTPGGVEVGAHTDNPQTGAGYRLVLTIDGQEVVVEDGKRFREWKWIYTPEMAFFSPAGGNAMIVIGISGMGYEGTHESWMTNGLSLP